MIQDATERYRKSQDKVGQYIEDVVVVSGTGNDFVLKTTLSRSFKAWCKLRYNYSIEADDLFKRLDETYDSDKFRYKGFVVNGLEEELVHETIFVGREEEFIKVFERKFVVTLDRKNDCVKRSDIQLWCKEINLRDSSTQEISKILLKRYNIDCNNPEFCKAKKVNKQSQYVIFGLKAIEL
jgi:hypothetical protein